MDLRNFEDGILDSGQIIRRAGHVILGNAGKIIAALVALIMLAVTFTDITFTGIFTESFASSLLLLITSSYVIYFSLEDSGEKYGMETEEYRAASERYDKLRGRFREKKSSRFAPFARNTRKESLASGKRTRLFHTGSRIQTLKHISRAE